MSAQRTPALTGGCQCGAVRYALYAVPTDPHICHCRMCQKAFGSYFAPLAGVDRTDFAWTRGAPKTYFSSDVTERGFCADCGTPLSFRWVDRNFIAVSLGSLDDPNALKPIDQCGLESKVGFFADLDALQGTRTEEEIPADRMPKLRSRQHPDHDTDAWPAKE